VTGCARNDEPTAIVADHVVTDADISVFEPDTLLHGIRDVAISEGGTVWVLSRFEPFLWAFSQRGDLLFHTAGYGEGPGELKNPWYLEVTAVADSQIVKVWDVGKRRFERFGLDGTYLGGTTLSTSVGIVVAGVREGSYAEPLRFAAFDDVTVLEVYDGVVSDAAGLWNGRLVSVGPDGSFGASLVDFSDLQGDQEIDLPDVFPPAPLWSGCGGSSLAVLNPLTNTVVRIHEDGTEERTGLNLVQVPVMDEDVERFVAHSVELEARERGVDGGSPGFVQLVKRAVLERISSAPEVAPPVRVRCDVAGRLWIQLFGTRDDPRGFGRYWQVVAGERTEVVQFPRRFQPLHFGSDHIAGFLEDEFGVQSVAVVPMPR
jgi:hypothetical protein